MNRAKLLILCILLVCTSAWAQQSTVTIGTNPIGAAFFVDGVSYVSTQAFVWPAGSKHIVQFIFTTDVLGNSLGFQQSNDAKVRFQFAGWQANGVALGSGSPAVTLTASPTLTSVMATLTEQFLLHVQFYNTSGTATCGGAPGPPAAAGLQYGIVYVGGTCVANTTDIWQTAGPVTLAGFPYPGYVFAGWIINNQSPNPFLYTYNLKDTTTIVPNFQPAKRVHFITNPPGLTVLVDRSTSTTPLVPSDNSGTCTPAYNQLPPSPSQGVSALCIGDFDFLPNSPHTIGAATPQRDPSGNYWIFQGFSNGLGQNAMYYPDQYINVATTVTANFIPGVRVSLVLSQPGLQLTVDGRSNWQGYNFVWGQGETHTVSVAPTQMDSNGRMWKFLAWSNGGAAASQTITVPSNTTNYAVTANFQKVPQAIVSSAPSGLSVSVDGAACTTPCVINRDAGSVAQVTIPGSIPSTSTSRFDFSSWSDGSSAPARQIAFNQDTTSVTANFHTSWFLQAAGSPATGGSFAFSPTSPDGFYADGTQVTVTVTPKAGYKLVKWDGDLTGTFSTGYLMMTSPHVATAYFQSVPFISPAGIMSAAGATPDGTMAPGSIISIYGQNLAPDLQTGGTNPLPQTLGGITVTIGNYLLPLLFVSPTQINAQVPSELVDGNYTLLVHQVGQPDVPGQLTISRDAPGVFTQANDQNLPLVLALHEDGSLITPGSPALHGETISIFGTGFGPYDNTVIDGFFVPATPPSVAVDAVTLNLGTMQKTPDWVGAATGMVGMTVMKLKITDDLPTATALNFTVTVNAKTSTQVTLPLQ